MRIPLTSLVLIFYLFSLGCPPQNLRDSKDKFRDYSGNYSLVSPPQSLQEYQWVNFIPFENRVGGEMPPIAVKEINTQVVKMLRGINSSIPSGKILKITGSVISFEREPFKAVVRTELEDDATGASKIISNLLGEGASSEDFRPLGLGITLGLKKLLQENDYILANFTNEEFLKPGRIGLVLKDNHPEIKIETPTAGPLMGALKGGILGMVTGSVGAAALIGGDYKGDANTENSAQKSSDKKASWEGALVLVAVGAIIGGILGIFEGALTAESSEKVEYTKGSLEDSLTNINLGELLQEKILQEGSSKTQYEIVSLSKSDWEIALDSGETISQNQDFAYFLELSSHVLGLNGDWKVDPQFYFYEDVEVRLVRGENRQVYFEEKFSFQTEKNSFEEWAKDEAKLFRESLENGHLELAKKITIHLEKNLSDNRIYP